VTWDNVFDCVSKESKQVIMGEHITCPSVMDETKEYIAKILEKGDFIDPEIGQMALGAREIDVNFSYLHIISDNVVKSHEHNLSNERIAEIQNDRKSLFLEISQILEDTISKM
jgi:hypothetical protein